MAKISKFEELECWKEARKLIKMTYQLTNKGVVVKDFDFKSQIRRASISTMNNIAEGFGRFSNKEFVRFLEYSSSSAQEVKSMCYLLIDLEYATKDESNDLMNQAEKTKRLTLGLLKYVKSKC